MRTKKTKKKKLPSLPLMKRKAVRLWADLIRDMHNGRCAICGNPHPRLNSHHIESRTNYALRFDLMNGIALCPEHHVFSRDAVHRGIFFYEWLRRHRPAVIPYLRRRRLELVNFDRETLEKVLQDLSGPVPKELYKAMGLNPPDPKPAGAEDKGVESTVVTDEKEDQPGGSRGENNQ